MKIGNTRAVLALAFGFVILSSVTTSAFATFAPNHNNSTSFPGNRATDLGEPFLVQHYETNSEQPGPINTTESENFTGDGVINGSLAITVQGNATETFRDNQTSLIQGTTKYMTDDGGNALYDFEAIGTYYPDGTFQSRGAAVFDDGATGELSSLGNTVTIYKDRADTNGNGTFLMWYWK